MNPLENMEDEKKIKVLQGESEVPGEWPWHEYVPEHHDDRYPFQEQVASVFNSIHDVFKRLWSI